MQTHLKSQFKLYSKQTKDHDPFTLSSQANPPPHTYKEKPFIHSLCWTLCHPTIQPIKPVKIFSILMVAARFLRPQPIFLVHQRLQQQQKHHHHQEQQEKQHQRKKGPITWPLSPHQYPTPLFPPTEPSEIPLPLQPTVVSFFAA